LRQLSTRRNPPSPFSRSIHRNGALPRPIVSMVIEPLRSHCDAGLDASTTQVISVKVQCSASKRQSVEEVLRIFFSILWILKLQGDTHAEFGLVRRRQNLLLDDPEGHREARLEEPKCFRLSDPIHSGRWL
jgi:hypothetical protein